jgi:hypothetical protein
MCLITSGHNSLLIEKRRGMSLTTSIVTALAVGAITVRQPTVSQVVKFRYEVLRALIRHKYSTVNIDLIENDPASEPWRAVVEEDLLETDAEKDQELLHQVKALLRAVLDQPLEVIRGATRVDPRDIIWALFTIEAVIAGEAVVSRYDLFPALDEALSYMSERDNASRIFTSPGGSGNQKVQFTAYYPTEVKPALWYKILACVHIVSVRSTVHEDSQIRLGQNPENYRKGHGQATETIARGTEIVVVPELPGCRFNPPKASVLWLEDWHCLEFRIQASEELPGFAWDTATNGRLAFYVGPILIAEVKIWAHCSRDADAGQGKHLAANNTTNPYQAVFVSYSH